MDCGGVVSEPWNLQCNLELSHKFRVCYHGNGLGNPSALDLEIVVLKPNDPIPLVIEHLG